MLEQLLESKTDVAIIDRDYVDIVALPVVAYLYTIDRYFVRAMGKPDILYIFQQQ